ncbi:hypothetical protein RJ640_005003 [Escallonia rubra]|uniref:Uncharacterized protein n=1 Tax=Escallonia rubra TaxID=112253 RepID=A0AA88U531_9ASTE|nr:hypothetical protein RJ640_005003 [Escallonia rubra]
MVPPTVNYRKAFYYNFVPSKVEDEAAKSNNTRFGVTRNLVEFREFHPASVFHPAFPWQIRKILVLSEVYTGKFNLSFNDTFEYIFRHWEFDMANHVASGKKLFVMICDVTDEKRPISHINMYFEQAPDDSYLLESSGLVREHRLKEKDEIGLFWDTRFRAFHFKLLHRGPFN